MAMREPPHRVGEHAIAVDFDQHRRVAEPCRTQARRGRRGPRAARIRRRKGLDGRRRSLPHRKSDNEGEGASGSRSPDMNRMNVVESLAGPQRRSLHALEAQTFGLVAERFHVAGVRTLIQINP
jgi:hypothetical protein